MLCINQQATTIYCTQMNIIGLNILGLPSFKAALLSPLIIFIKNKTNGF
jgi:hypothetical protein